MANTERRERIAETTDQPSYLHEIRDVFFNVFDVDPFFAQYVRRKTKRLIVQPEDLPYLGIYIIDEVMTPDGDFNMGMTKFSHTGRIGFSVLIAHNDSEVAEGTADAAFKHIMERLWTDAKVMNMFEAESDYNPSGVKIEGLTRGNRRHVYGTFALNNTTPLAELQYDVTVFFRSYYYPWITDDFLRMDVYTRLKQGQLPIKIRYLFEPSEPEE